MYSLNNIAATYTNSEQYELAIESYEASVKDRTNSLGATHEDTLYTIKILDIVRYKLANKTNLSLAQTGKGDKSSVNKSVNKGENTSQNTTDILVTDEGAEGEETASDPSNLNLFKTDEDIARESTVTSTSAAGENGGDREERSRLLTIRCVNVCGIYRTTATLVF